MLLISFVTTLLLYIGSARTSLFAYEYNGYWKDVGTLGSYWEANMELIDIIPEFNLYEEFWKIYTKGDIIQPQYISEEAVLDRCLIGEGSEIYGEVHNSVIGPNVVISLQRPFSTGRQPDSQTD